MAKRKRLTPARPDFLTAPEPAPETKSMTRAPIAQVAGDAAAVAAVRELSEELRTAREQGRMVLNLPLEQVQAEFLVRDRVDAEPEAQAALVASIRERGQQTPIEVQALPDGSYGLISGWRRLLALRQLHAETGEARFATIQALLRRPEDQAQAYVAMVEENEVRADLSYFERARIVRRAVATGVFETEKQALQRLFSAASYAKRSKIKSFLPLVDGLGDVLRFPSRIPERTGLALARVLERDRDALRHMREVLQEAPAETPEQEARILARLISGNKSLKGGSETDSGKSGKARDGGGDRAPAGEEVAPGIRLTARKGRLELEGPGVDAGLIERLRIWLNSQG